MFSTLIVATFSLLLSWSQASTASGQQQPVSNDEKACVIVKRMGPADEITSHFYSFGIRGKQFQYVEGNYPSDIKFHGRLTDNDVRHVMEKGGKIRIVEPGYSQSDLEMARRSCASNQQIQDTAATPAPKQGTSSDPPSLSPSPVSNQNGQSPNAETVQPANVSISSNPENADVYVDGEFVSNAPAVLKLDPGKHTVKLTKAGYKEWSRDITAHGGSEVHLAAILERLN